jgi:hypothetical protein
VEVSGQVLFQGKPLPGGTVQFVSVVGAFASNGIIDEKGKYSIKAPVGDVRISVDNRVLRKEGKGANLDAVRRGAGRPDSGDPDPVKGTYKQIPAKYYDPDNSGLTYTVTNGPQTHDIELN